VLREVLGGQLTGEPGGAEEDYVVLAGGGHVHSLRAVEPRSIAAGCREFRVVESCSAEYPEGVIDMKNRNSLRSLKSKAGSYVVRRRGRTFVMNKKNPRLKARQG
jgi:large subunit ribosomal protein L36